jgi:hypothetical protein
MHRYNKTLMWPVARGGSVHLSYLLLLEFQERGSEEEIWT